MMVKFNKLFFKHPVRLERTRFSFRFQDREIQKTGC